MRIKKKYINFLRLFILLILFIFITLFLIKYLKKEHKVSYRINKYNIIENFVFKDNKHYYNIIIKDSKNEFIYTTNNNYTKDKQIIKNIISETYSKNTCIMPVYKNNNKGNVLCTYGDKIVSLFYLKSISIDSYNNIIKKFKKDGYNVNVDNKDNIKTYKKLSIYKDNIDNNDMYVLWNYKGLYLINKKETKYRKLLDEDKYENELASLVGKYYVFMDTNNRYNGFKLYYYDIEKNKLKEYSKTKYKIDDDLYFSGVYNNKLYIYDKYHKKQYVFNPYEGKLKKIGDKVNGFYLLKNNNLKLVDYYEFKEVIFFNKGIDNNKLDKLYNPKNIYLVNNYYYIYSNDGYFYKVDSNNIKNSIILFKIDNINSFIIRDDKIVISMEDNLYSYDLINGLLNIINYDELKYNFENIFDYYKKN